MISINFICREYCYSVKFKFLGIEIAIISLQMVAIKTVRTSSDYNGRRERELMCMLDHCNVVKLLYVFLQPGHVEGEKFLNLVMEFWQMSIFQYIFKLKKVGLGIPKLTVKVYCLNQIIVLFI